MGKVSRPLVVRRAPTIGGAMALCLVAAACGGSSKSVAQSGGTAPASGSYKVVIVSDLTGSSNVTGIPVADGLESAFDAINAAGGVNGHKIQYTQIDSQSSATVSPAAGRQAVGDQPVAIFDGSPSSLFADRLPVYQSAAIPVLSAEASSFGFLPWLFSTAPTAQQSAVALAGSAGAAAKRGLKGLRVAVEAIASPQGQAATAAEESALKAGDAVIANTQFNPIGTPSFAAGAADMIASKPDVVTLTDSSAATVIEANALVSAGFKGPIVANYDAADDESLKAIGAPQYVAIRLTQQASPGTGMYTAASRFNHVAGTSNLLFGSAWTLAYTFAQGLERCTSSCSSPAAVENGINSLGSFSVPGGALAFGNAVVSGTRHYITAVGQLYAWDSATQSAVKVGAPVQLGPDA
jgi:branched-chain amino acid transport system substrate-binding protein